MPSDVVSFKAPRSMVEELDQAVEEGHYTSRGEFLRSLLRNLEHKRLSEQARQDIEDARGQEGRPIDEL